MLFGSSVVEAEILGIRAGKHTQGHRFHGPKPAGDQQSGEVRRDSCWRRRMWSRMSNVRRERIRTDVNAIAESHRRQAVIEDKLLDEVTSLVEWPVRYRGTLR